MAKPETAPIPLSEFVRQLRDELKKARDDGEGEDLRFEVGPIEVELAVEARKELHAGGGLRIYVFEAGASERLADVSTQRVRLSLNPEVLRSPEASGPGGPAPEPDASGARGGSGAAVDRDDRFWFKQLLLKLPRSR